MTCNLCTSLQPLNFKFSEECLRTLGRGWNLPGHNWRAVAEVEAIRKQQRKWTLLGNSNCIAEVDAIEEQQLNRMNQTRSGSSS